MHQGPFAWFTLAKSAHVGGKAHVGSWHMQRLCVQCCKGPTNAMYAPQLNIQHPLPTSAAMCTPIHLGPEIHRVTGRLPEILAVTQKDTQRLARAEVLCRPNAHNTLALHMCSVVWALSRMCLTSA
jgi:hypothetical protein